jgi:hypothetical protein
MVEQSHLRPVQDPADQRDRQPQRARAAKSLPTDRMKFGLQVKVLQTIGRLSGPGKRAVTAQDLSRAVEGVSEATIGLSHGFFLDSGWIERQGRGRYVATDCLIEYTRRLATAASEPGRAVAALRDPVRQSWYWQVLQPHLGAGPLPINEAIVMLMREADASDGHVNMLRNIVQWLTYVELVALVGDGRIAIADGAAEPAHQDRPQAQGSPAPRATDPKGEKPTTSQGGAPPDVVLAFGFDLRLTADDLSRLDPEQIKALFDAVGAVLAIKNARQ